MTAPYLGNPKRTIEVLQKYEFVFQKKFGQNFLIDTHVLDKIVKCCRDYKRRLCSGDWSRYRDHDPVSGQCGRERSLQ